MRAWAWATVATVLGGTVPAAALLTWLDATGRRASAERILFGDRAVITWLSPTAAEALRARPRTAPPGGARYLVHQRHEAGAGDRPVRRLVLEPLAAGAGGPDHLAAHLARRTGATTIPPAARGTIPGAGPARVIVETRSAGDPPPAAHDLFHVATDGTPPEDGGIVATIDVDTLERQRLDSYVSLRRPLVALAGTGVASAGTLVWRRHQPVGAAAGAGAVLTALAAVPVLTGTLRALAPPRPATVDLQGPGPRTRAGRLVAGAWVAGMGAVLAAGAGRRPRPRDRAPHAATPLVAGAFAVALAAVDVWLASVARSFAGAYDGFASMAGATAGPYRDAPLSANDVTAVTAAVGPAYRNRFRFVNLAGTLALVSGVDPGGFGDLRYRYRRALPAGAPGPGQAVVSGSLARRLGGRAVPLTIAGPDGPRHPEVVAVLDDPTWMAGIVVLNLDDVERTFGAAGASTVLTRAPLDPAMVTDRSVTVEPVRALQRGVTRGVAVARLPLGLGLAGALAVARCTRPRPRSAAVAGGALVAGGTWFALCYGAAGHLIGLGSPAPTGWAARIEMAALAAAIAALAGTGSRK